MNNDTQAGRAGAAIARIALDLPIPLTTAAVLGALLRAYQAGHGAGYQGAFADARYYELVARIVADCARSA